MEGRDAEIVAEKEAWKSEATTPTPTCGRHPVAISKVAISAAGSNGPTAQSGRPTDTNPEAALIVHGAAEATEMHEEASKVVGDGRCPGAAAAPSDK